MSVEPTAAPRAGCCAVSMAVPVDGATAAPTGAAAIWPPCRLPDIMNDGPAIVVVDAAHRTRA